MSVNGAVRKWLFIPGECEKQKYKDVCISMFVGVDAEACLVNNASCSNIDEAASCSGRHNHDNPT